MTRGQPGLSARAARSSSRNRPPERPIGGDQSQGVEQVGAANREDGKASAMQTKGINPLALVCRDMAETVEFYTKVLNMPLVKTVQLPDGGQHFFFDCG